MHKGILKFFEVLYSYIFSTTGVLNMPERQQTQKSTTESKSTFQKQAPTVKQTPISNPMAIIQRARINPKSLTHTDVMQLQRTIGNRAVGKLLSEIGLIPSKVNQAPVQRQEIPEEEEPLQGKMEEPLQRQEIPEEEEPLQGKMLEPIQSQEIPEEEEPLQGVFEKEPKEETCSSCMQRQEIPEEEESLQGKFEGDLDQTTCPSCSTLPIQREEENHTGMPDNLKTGVENLSGIDMSDIKVHYNSSKPAEVGALAYTQGTNIHVAPGQEKHLPHEAWHVVQQAQGRVKPTMQLKDVAVNDDAGLEQEADMMGGGAVQMTPSFKMKFTAFTSTSPNMPIQKEICPGCGANVKPGVCLVCGMSVPQAEGTVATPQALPESPPQPAATTEQQPAAKHHKDAGGTRSEREAEAAPLDEERSRKGCGDTHQEREPEAARIRSVPYKRRALAPAAPQPQPATPLTAAVAPQQEAAEKDLEIAVESAASEGGTEKERGSDQAVEATTLGLVTPPQQHPAVLPESLSRQQRINRYFNLLQRGLIDPRRVPLAAAGLQSVGYMVSDFLKVRKLHPATVAIIRGINIKYPNRENITNFLAVADPEGHFNPLIKKELRELIVEKIGKTVWIDPIGLHSEMQIFSRQGESWLLFEGCTTSNVCETQSLKRTQLGTRTYFGCKAAIIEQGMNLAGCRFSRSRERSNVGERRTSKRQEFRIYNSEDIVEWFNSNYQVQRVEQALAISGERIIGREQMTETLRDKFPDHPHHIIEEAVDKVFAYVSAESTDSSIEWVHKEKPSPTTRSNPVSRSSAAATTVAHQPPAPPLIVPPMALPTVVLDPATAATTAARSREQTEKKIPQSPEDETLE